MITRPRASMKSCAGMCGLQLGSRADSHDQAVLNRDATVVEKRLAVVVRDQAAIADQQMRRLLPDFSIVQWILAKPVA